MKTLKTLGLLTGLLLLSAACQIPVSGNLNHRGLGQLSINASARTVHPFADESKMNMTEFRLSLTPKDGQAAVSAVTRTEPSFLVPNLGAGKWDLQVEGRNASGDLLATASGEVLIIADELVQSTLILQPYGTGGLSTAVDWSSVPSLAGLTLSSPETLKLTVNGVDTPFVVGTKTASYSASGLSSGRYEVVWQIVNANGSIGWGAKDLFYVYDGKTTSRASWVLTATELNVKPEVAPVKGVFERSPEKIILNWTMASARVESYIVERSTDQVTWTELTSDSQKLTDTRFTDVLVNSDQGKTYYYRVRGVNSFGQGANSDPFVVLVPTVKTIADVVIDAGSDPALRNWTSDNTYVVTSISIQPGATLTIEKGTRIRVIRDLADLKKFTIKGSIIVNGTAEEPVVITSNTPDGVAGAPGDWGVFEVLASSTPAVVSGGAYQSGTLLRHLVLENGSGLSLVGAYPYLDHVTIRQSSASSSGVFNLTNADPAKTLYADSLTLQDVTGSYAMYADSGWDFNFKNLSINRAPTINLYSPKGTFDGGEWKGQVSTYWWYTAQNSFSSSNNLVIKNLVTDSNLSFSSGSVTLDKVTMNGGTLSASYLDSMRVTDSIFKGQSGSSSITNSYDVVWSGVQWSQAKVTDSLISFVNNNGLFLHHNQWLENSARQIAEFRDNTNLVFVGNTLNNPVATYLVRNSAPDTDAPDVVHVAAANNYWGVTTGESIKAAVYDYYDTGDKGKILYTPWLTAAPASGDVLVGLESPAPLTTVTGVNMTFRWKMFNLTTVTLQVSSDSTFPATAATSSMSVTGTSQGWVAPDAGKYYWRITNGTGTVYSEVRELNVTL